MAEEKDGTAGTTSIAVLPFDDLTEDNYSEFFSDGLTEEVQSLIVRLGEFRVVNLSTSIQLKDTVMDVMSVATRVGAEVVQPAVSGRRPRLLHPHRQLNRRRCRQTFEVDIAAETRCR